MLINTRTEYYGPRVTIMDTHPEGGTWLTALIFIDGYLCGQVCDYQSESENSEDICQTWWFGEHSEYLDSSFGGGFESLGKNIDSALSDSYDPRDHMGTLPVPTPRTRPTLAPPVDVVTTDKMALALERIAHSLEKIEESVDRVVMGEDHVRVYSVGE